MGQNGETEIPPAPGNDDLGHHCYVRKHRVLCIAQTLGDKNV